MPRRVTRRTSRPRIVLATCAEVADLDDEGRLLAAALRQGGAEVVAAVWDDRSVDWAGFDLVVVRSTWDYAERLEEFLGWAAAVESVTRLQNPAALLRWTCDKHYLLDLERAGVPVVPSTFVEPGDAPEHPLLDVEHVVKPAVSAGSRDTLRLRPQDRERSVGHVSRLLAQGRSVLVQPYLADVDTAGETAVVAIGGEVSHALRKEALLQPGADLVEGLYAQEQMSPRDAERAELDVARAALRAISAERPPLYARVDLLPAPQGPLLLELELAEPSLFLEHVPGTAERLAAAVLGGELDGI